MTLPKLGHTCPPQPHRTRISCCQTNFGRFYKSQEDQAEEPLGSFLPPYLDDKVHITLVLITGDGSVRPDDQVAIDSGREIDMFAWRPCRELRKGCSGPVAILSPFKKLREAGENKGVLLPTVVPMSHQAGTIPL